MSRRILVLNECSQRAAGEGGNPRFTGTSHCAPKPIGRDDIKRIQVGVERISKLLEEPDTLMSLVNSESTERSIKATSKQETEGVQLLLHVVAALAEQDVESE